MLPEGPHEHQPPTVASPRRPVGRPAAPGRDEPPPVHPRYDPREQIGAGGQGVVFRVFDRELSRDVALKTLHAREASEAATQHFLREAAATAVLEHPNIVPIHDLGRLDDGRPFYTMRLVSGRSLANVLQELRHGAAEGRGDGEWSLVRLVQIVQGACLALQFAHERGVVHRDVKPANILVGEFGEVLVVDWGISRRSEGRGSATLTGQIQGTLSYMSPEQARGEAVDVRTDVYSLGVVLYECLTHVLPHEGASDADLIAAVLRDPPAPPDQRTRRLVPPELSALVLAALVKDRDQRLQSARELHDELQRFVEGVRDRAKRMDVAEGLCARGQEALKAHAASLLELEALRRDVARLAAMHPPWQPVAEKRLFLTARRQAQDAEDRSRQEFLEAVHHFTDALAWAPEHAGARRTLADVFWRRFTEAEQQMDRPLAQVYRSLVERFHDGRYARELEGKGSLDLRTWPARAEVSLHPQVETDLVMTDGPARRLRAGDARLGDLAMGSYVVVARAPGHVTARLPVTIFRNTDWAGALRLLKEGSVPDGFVHVPGAEAWLGGDALATNGLPLRRVAVGSFLMQRHPVTFGEWCEYLDAVGAAPGDASVPLAETTGLLCELDGTGAWRPVTLGVWSTESAERFGAEAVGRVPVFGVSREQAEAYAAWTARRLGARVRLPTADEWEYAARGTDRRLYPWGDQFDSSLCHLRESLPQPGVGPVGAFPTDCSPAGVRDMAGCIQELTGSWFDEARGLVEVRGGGWGAGAPSARCAWRGTAAAATRNVGLGFRLAIELDDAATEAGS